MSIDPAKTQFYYYDSDYPWADMANFDVSTGSQGIAYDVQRYLDIAATVGGPILELCCGTGRVAIPLARAGHAVTAVDREEAQLSRFREHLAKEDAAVRDAIDLVEGDATQLDLGGRRYRLAIIAFNSLMILADFDAQQRALESVARHMEPNAILLIDILNPFRLDFHGNSVPYAYVTRTNPHTGNLYTRFALSDPFDADHRQRLHGWYDEIDAQGRVMRRPYVFHWRAIFRHELLLMLAAAGFEVSTWEGGHHGEAYTFDSPRMFVRARYDVYRQLVTMQARVNMLAAQKPKA